MATASPHAGGPPCRPGDHQDVWGPPARCAALRNRRQAALRQGNRRRAAARRNRPGRAQQQRHARDRSWTGSTIAAVLPREDPRRRRGPAGRVPVRSRALDRRLVRIVGQTPTFGTGSVRRVAQLSRVFPGARFAPIRGNLDTRLRKLDEGQHDALVLAAAGLRRLGFASRISLALPAEACVPAPGQGIVAIEIRRDDADDARGGRARSTTRLAAAALVAERELVAALGGGCQTPIGALASCREDGDDREHRRGRGCSDGITHRPSHGTR